MLLIRLHDGEILKVHGRDSIDEDVMLSQWKADRAIDYVDGGGARIVIPFELVGNPIIRSS